MAGRAILVIKLSALGDFIQALGPMSAIRAHHSGDKITLLTTKPYGALAEASPYFDQVIIDERPPRWRLDRMAALSKTLRAGQFEQVYDLQTSGRSSSYFKLFAKPRPAWSGIAAGCSHPHANPKRDFMHTIERQAEQLAMAGIAKTPLPDLSWAEADLSGFDLPEDFVLIAPGGAAHRPDKRWPVEQYGALATQLSDAGLVPALIGAKAEETEAETILQACPQALNLVGRTDFLQLAALARRARAAVGNDTGPMHLFAAAGCRSVVLYSHASDPALCAQRGPDVSILREENLAELAPEIVFAALNS